MTKIAPKTIVYIDDDATQLKSISLALHGHNYQVHTFENPDQAIDFILSTPIDVIISDIVMPNNDGFDVCLAIHELYGDTTPPIILLSGYILDEKDIKTSQDIGVSRILTKPIKIAPLVEIIEEVLMEANHQAPQRAVIDIDKIDRYRSLIIRRLIQIKLQDEVKLNFILDKLLTLNRVNEGTEKDSIIFMVESGQALTDSDFAFIHFLEGAVGNEGLDYISGTLSPGCIKNCSRLCPITVADNDPNDTDDITPKIDNYFAAPDNHTSQQTNACPIKRLLTIPLFEHGKKVALLGVANKQTDYTEWDGIRLELFSNRTWDSLTSKRAQEEIHLREEMMRQAEKAASIGFWRLNWKNKQLRWSREIYNILGLNKEDYEPSYEQFLDLLHPHDKEKVDTALQNSLVTGDDYQIEHRIIHHQSGEIRYVLEHCIHKKDQAGTIVSSIGTMHDITASKMNEIRYKNAVIGSVDVLRRAQETRDPYTAGHQSRVATIACLIGRKLGLTADQLLGLELGSKIHDIGKIYVPSEILNRPGRLSTEEMALVKTHVNIGYNIIKDVDFPWPIADIAHQHHERLDGTGYPQGLKGDDICIEAKIVAVADVFEAITSHRPYRAALPVSVALTELTEKRGIAYDAAVVDCFFDLYNEKPDAFHE